MIKERYCSRKVAKLLKEKGFNEDCYTYYDDIDDSIKRFDKGYHFNNTSYPWGVPYFSKAKKYLVAPTQSMVMDWLREVHKLHIEFVLNQDVENEESVIESYYHFNVSRLDRFVNEGGDCEFYNSYEEACEAAIKYCLENLIN